MSEFTKGPWVVNDGANSKFMSGKITTVGNEVVICDEPSQYFGLDVAKSNAKLIACAPEMYEMLEGKLELIRSGIDASYHGHPEKNSKYLEVVELLKRARGE